MEPPLNSNWVVGVTILCTPISARRLTMVLSEKWLGPSKTPGRGNALTAKDPGLAAVPIASPRGISIMGIFFLTANSFKSRADFTEIISIQRMRAHTCPS